MAFDSNLNKDNGNMNELKSFNGYQNLFNN